MKNEEFIRKLSLISKCIVIIMLVFAVAELPYGYYTLLRWTVFLFSIWHCSLTYKSERIARTISYAGLAILFNPIILVSFEKATWAIIDIIAGLIILSFLAFELYSLRKNEKLR